MDYVYAFNAFEAVLWSMLAIFCEVSAAKLPERRWKLLVAAITFVAFAGSEITEMQTGAWWRPIWLLVWKAACIVTLVAIGVDHYYWQKNRRCQNNRRCQENGPGESDASP